MASILVVEDDVELKDVIASMLTSEGHSVDSVLDSSGFYSCIKGKSYDLVLMDQVLSGNALGTEMVKEMRQHPQFKLVPVIMLTGCGTEEEKVYGLSAGADDYVTKPFSSKELMARISAALRRAKLTTFDKVSDRNIVLDFGTHRVLVDGKDVHLTLTEFKILSELLNQTGKVISRTDLCDRVLGRADVTDRTIDVHVASLRKKLKNRGNAIKTVRGVGYRFSA